MGKKTGTNEDEPAPLELRKWRKADGLEKLRMRVHRALRTAEKVMYQAGREGDRSDALRAATVVQQTARTYLKVLEVDELEERVEALEQAYENTNGQLHYN